MIVGLLILSIIVGGTCGITAFFLGFGLLQSVLIYVVAAQLPFLVVPLLIVTLEYLSTVFQTSLQRSRLTEAGLSRGFTKSG